MKKLCAALLLCVSILPAQTVVSGGRTFKGAVDAHGATKTLPHRSGTGSPNGRDNCATIGETFFQTDATAGSNSWGCTGTGTPGTWTLQGGGASSGFSCRDTTATYNATGTGVANTSRCLIPAGTMSAGKIISIVNSGTATSAGSQNALPQLDMCTVQDCGSGTKTALGGIAAAPTFALATNGGWRIVHSCVVLTAGASGTLECGTGVFNALTSSSGSSSFFTNTATVTIDTTVDQYVQVDLTTMTLTNFKSRLMTVTVQ
jgi:hypothetical protein